MDSSSVEPKCASLLLVFVCYSLPVCFDIRWWYIVVGRSRMELYFIYYSPSASRYANSFDTRVKHNNIVFTLIISCNFMIIPPEHFFDPF